MTSPTDLSLVLALQAPYVDAPRRRSTEQAGPGDALWSWVSESLVPLLNLLDRLEREEIEAPVSLAVSPLLCEMLADIEAAPAYLKYLHRQSTVARAQSQVFASRGQEKYRDGCAFWEAWHQTIERDFRERYALDLLGALRDLASRGRVELLAMPATLAPLPLLASDASVRAQLSLSVESFKKHFGRAPRGLWTCHGLERGASEPSRARSDVARLIAGAGFEYVIEGAATTLASQATHDAGTRYEAERLGWLRDVLPQCERDSLPQSGFGLRLRGALAYVRPHAAASEQAWHPRGYAGEEMFLCPWRRHQPGSLRLWRNTGEGTPASMLEAYEALGTPAICEAQATHWLDKVHVWAQGSPSLCVAFDAALFGSLWSEGHAWLARALKHAASDGRFRLQLASHALTLGSLESASTEPEATAAKAQDLSQSPTAWLNGRTESFWAEVRQCEGAMEEMARLGAGTSNPKLREILNQCARELLLIQSCDWPLLLASSPPRPWSEDDARTRLAEHLEAFRCLTSIAATVARGEFMTEGQRVFLEALCERDDVLPSASFAAWGEA